MVTLVVGALIGKLAGIIAQIPACGNTQPDAVPGLEAFTLLGNVFESGDVSGTPENTIGPIPVVSSDQANAPSLLKSIQAYRWFIEHGGRHGSGWQNLETRASPETGGGRFHQLWRLNKYLRRS
ncbi:hypothetical protein [Parasedimentitalea psychrophila]|uniref:Uncharacterized protein n=1 Tax=Parasedimentitalea psychrophila TaxID=2997337 RepID=A0A9Y2P6Z4_9RHOB|nr:hypothetical protein [Parasedimentitalea psychrophila]WIY25245.1 hypothetical protein QPJ95_22650 [Parasedimentitalea psychrophila]